MARSFEKLAEPTFQTVKGTPAKQPPTGAVDTVGPCLPLIIATNQASTNQAAVQQKCVPSTSTAMSAHRPHQSDSEFNQGADMENNPARALDRLNQEKGKLSEHTRSLLLMWTRCFLKNRPTRRLSRY